MKRSKPMFYGTEIAAALLYLCSISAALMYVLCRSHAAVCTVLMTALCCGMYMLFYALRRRKFFSLLAFIVLFFIVYFVVGPVGSPYVSPSFMEFIFRSSDFFSPVYAGAAIVLFSFIIAFPTCYFTAYLPRPCFLLLPAFVPLILAARTMGGIPAGYMVFMAVGFMLSAVGSARPEFPAENTYVDDKRARYERLAVMGAAGVIAAALLFVIPKDTDTPMLQYIDSVLMSQTNFFGRRALSNFVESSQPNRGNNNPSTDILFYAQTAYPANVGRWSFDVYNGDDGWTYNGDFSAGEQNWEESRRRLSPDSLIYSLKKGVSEGKLEKYKDELDRVSVLPRYDHSARMTIQVVDNSSTAVVMHPSQTFGVNINTGSGTSPVTYRNRKDEIFTQSAFGRNPVYSLEYYTDEPNAQFLNMLTRVDFRDLLSDAAREEVISESVRDDFALESDMANLYYMAGLDGTVTERIQETADEITAGLESDYEKALAIEQWFGRAGFVYDMDFVPDSAEAEYFMFDSKRGICTDFATASTLLLRAAGIPARYTEGFVLKEDSVDAYGRFSVTAANAHAYSTAYIEGYGWLEIDGTRYAEVSGGFEEATVVMTAIVAAAGVLLVLGIIFRRQLSEALFAVTYRFGNDKRRVRAVYLRTRRLACRIAEREPRSTTADEVRDIISRTLSLDKEAAEITAAADELFYGSGEPRADTKRLYDDYRAILKMKRSRRR
ncbi:MAG: transglutaminase-like domain-containing protein [Ruminococcus sp.]|nr:transglutaminase-like domain-containing protein [Ruminococcus sp.]